MIDYGFIKCWRKNRKGKKVINERILHKNYIQNSNLCTRKDKSEIKIEI